MRSSSDVSRWAGEGPVWFIPGRVTPPPGPLARYRPLVPVGAVAQYVRQLTAPGEVVLDLFCQGPTFLCEAVLAGRRAVGVSVNPVGLLIAGLGLEPLPDPATLKAAFTRLADSAKGDLPLHRHVSGLYRTRCPECGSEGTAVWFAWDRDGGYPYAKAVRCPRCGEDQEGPTDQADIAAARRFPAKGLAYYYALNRVAPAGHPARERAAELVELYTPRNLSALMDVTLRLERLDLERRVRAVLQGLLLSAFDRGSGLDPHSEVRTRPRTLRLPLRFLERNIWMLLEEGLARQIARLPDEEPHPSRAPSLAALLADPTPAYVLTACAAREVGGLLGPQSVSLILADPPRPDGVFWALSALWSGWLWDAPQARALRPFLRRRRFDWEWHQGALQMALAAASTLLAPDGHVVVLFGAYDEGLLESACLAAGRAGYTLAGWGASAEVGCRLVWRRPEVREGRRPIRVRLHREGGDEASAQVSGRAAVSSGLMEEVARAAGSLAQRCLQERGEPTPWTVLHAAIYTGLSTLGLAQPSEEAGIPLSLDAVAGAVRQGLVGLGLEQVDAEADLYWLPALDAGPPLHTLADRLEEEVWKHLQARPAWELDELMSAVYVTLNGHLTPDPSLVLLCLDSYAVVEEGLWCLRPEDIPSQRAEEMQALRADLQALGKRLGFRMSSGGGWDVRWREGKSDAFLFAVSAMARLGSHLVWGPPVSPGARPCLVFPGGRAELLAHKLQRDPRLVRLAREKGWQFIKFRHLRRLIAEGLDRRTFETVLGLDPVTGAEGVQIPLILGGSR